MTGANAVFGALAVTGSALTAGVLLAVAISLVPVFLSLPAERYVRVHKVAGRHFDRFMPPTVLLTVAVDVLLTVRTGAALYAVAAAALLGVSLVSQLGNVPINRVVKALPDGEVPADWADPRRRWQRLHWLRTALAGVAVLLSVLAPVAL